MGTGGLRGSLVFRMVLLVRWAWREFSTVCEGLDGGACGRLDDPCTLPRLARGSNGRARLAGEDPRSLWSVVVVHRVKYRVWMVFEAVALVTVEGERGAHCIPVVEVDGVLLDEHGAPVDGDRLVAVFGLPAVSTA